MPSDPNKLSDGDRAIENQAAKDAGFTRPKTEQDAPEFWVISSNKTEGQSDDRD